MAEEGRWRFEEISVLSLVEVRLAMILSSMADSALAASRAERSGGDLGCCVGEGERSERRACVREWGVGGGGGRYEVIYILSIFICPRPHLSPPADISDSPPSPPYSTQSSSASSSTRYGSLTSSR